MSDLISTKEAAARLGITPRRVQALIAAGRLPATRIGRALVIRDSDLSLIAERPTGRPRLTSAGQRPGQ